MQRVEKTVFISYRRSDVAWALAIFQDLTHHGYDVFFDYDGLAGGDFAHAIVENIRARAHFLVVLTPSALDRCNDPSDWLRREIEAALESGRNVIPLAVDKFDFNAPSVVERLSGALATLKGYNELRVHADYFTEAMERLRKKRLSVALDAILHPASRVAMRAVHEQQEAAQIAADKESSRLVPQKRPSRDGIEVVAQDSSIDQRRAGIEVSLDRPRQASRNQMTTALDDVVQRDKDHTVAREMKAAAEAIEILLRRGDLSKVDELLRDNQRFSAEFEPYAQQLRVARAKREQLGRAQKTVVLAKQDFWSGRREEAFERLAAFRPSHDLVTNALAELREQHEEEKRMAADAKGRG